MARRAKFERERPERRKAKLFFQGTEEPLDARKFAEFIRLFTDVHNAATQLKRIYFIPPAEVARSRQLQLSLFQELNEIGGLLEDFRFPVYPDHALLIRSIRKRSPLEIVVIAIPTALTLAVIFSGGTIEMKGFKAQVPPLGNGIQALREALGTRRSRDTRDKSEET